MQFDSYNSLFKQISTEPRAFEFALQWNLIKKEGRICQCGAELTCTKDNNQPFGFRFRCSKSRSICMKTYSLLHGTWFARSHLPISDQIMMIYCYSLDMTPAQLTGMFGLGSAHTVVDWANYFRDVSAIYMAKREATKIGGLGCTMEIDETKVFKNKNHTGRLTTEQERHQWLFGGICRETKETFFCIVADRTEKTLMCLLQEHVEVGTHIISDCWSSYSRIASYGYTHSSVNHSENFVAPEDPNTHTQTIERTWRSLKENIPPGSRYESRINYILHYSFKRHTGWYGLVPKDRFSLLVNLIATYY
jgi:IS1 family transposase